jgi:hypothetical protein
MLSGVGDQREYLRGRRVDDPFHADGVSVHAPHPSAARMTGRFGDKFPSPSA